MLVRDTGAELLAEAAEQAAMLFGHVEAATAPSTGGDVSFTTLHGLFWLTANLCARKPLMLVIDDLHWADVPSLRLLTYLLPRLESLSPTPRATVAQARARPRLSQSRPHEAANQAIEAAFLTRVRDEADLAHHRLT